MLYTAFLLALVAQQSGAHQQQTGVQSVANPPAINGFVEQTDGQSASSERMGAAGDARFAKNAAIGGMTEVKLGQMAADKGSSDEVKKFGQKMVDDHSKAGDELKSIAAKNNMTLPSDLDAKHQAMVDKMSALSGKQFDMAYVNMMAKDHDQDVTEFQQEASNGTNADLRTFAGKTLKVVQQHDQMIHEIKNHMGGKGKMSSNSSGSDR